MVDKNIRLKGKNKTNDGFDNLFPQTKSDLVLCKDKTLTQVLDETTAQFQQTIRDSVNLSSMTGDITGYIAHRGYSRLAPENTLAAYRESYAHGYKVVELDISRTSDGVWVLMHDATVDRTTNGTGRVDELTLSQIKALDINFQSNRYFSKDVNFYDTQKVPTLDEFLKIAKTYKLLPQIEIQGSSDIVRDVGEVLAHVEKHRLENHSCIITAQLSVLEEVRKHSTRYYMMIVKVDLDQQAINEALSLGNCGIVADHNALTEAKINNAHKHGLEVGGYTVNDLNRARRLFEWGIDWVTTDELTGGGRL